METEKTRTGTSSKLLVTKATKADSGSYTCDPSRGQPKTADVHIITGLYNYKIFAPQKKIYLYALFSPNVKTLQAFFTVA